MVQHTGNRNSMAIDKNGTEHMASTSAQPRSTAASPSRARPSPPACRSVHFGVFCAAGSTENLELFEVPTTARNAIVWSSCKSGKIQQKIQYRKNCHAILIAGIYAKHSKGGC
jgi:hypothetical protein